MRNISVASPLARSRHVSPLPAQLTQRELRRHDTPYLIAENGGARPALVYFFDGGRLACVPARNPLRSCDTDYCFMKVCKKC